jgi:PHD/YefM family antitoxin component YafN of YafNO toxin-antitoxin module
MKIYTYSQARQQLAKVLDEAYKEGEVGIKRCDGKTFVLKSVKEKSSPLDVEGVDINMEVGELVDIVRESREKPKTFD